MSIKYKASAPGSLMLMGEHAVLHGKMALVCAIERRVNVTLTPRDDRTISINSSLLGQLRVAFDDLLLQFEPSSSPFSFVLAAVMEERRRLNTGFDLLIESECSDQLGFGSSAAVTVAVLAALHVWWRDRAVAQDGKKSRFSGDVKLADKERNQLLLAAHRAIKRVQGMGSAADAAASILGGVVVYRNTPQLDLVWHKIAATLPLTVVYSGKKVSTKEVVKQVSCRRNHHRKLFAQLDDLIEWCVKDAVVAIRARNWQRLGELVDMHQGFHEALGVNTAILARIVFALREDPGIYGAKISGAGMGDSVIGIGRPVQLHETGEIKINVDSSGLLLQRLQ
jgi:mevalonate kinase